MYKILAVSVLFLALPAHAVICKFVDEQGGVSYSDVPAEDCPTRVKLPEYSRYQPRTIEGGFDRGEGQGTEPEFTGYSGVRIAQPASGDTVRSNQGRVPVSVSMQPVLQPKHRVRLFLDSVLIQPDFANQSATLSGVERGSHTLGAHVVDENGNVLSSAVPVTFTLRKASILNQPDNGSDDPDSDSGGSTDGGGNTNTSSNVPNYSAPIGGGSAPHPSYRPSYAPN